MIWNHWIFHLEFLVEILMDMVPEKKVVGLEMESTIKDTPGLIPSFAGHRRNEKIMSSVKKFMVRMESLLVMKYLWLSV